MDSTLRTTPATTPDEFYKKNIALTVDESAALLLATGSQSRTNPWFLTRRLRVTTSLAKDIAGRRKKDFAPLVRRHLSCQCKGNKATRCGQEHEKVALDNFMGLFTAANGDLTESGLVVDTKEPWLAASPDGIISIDGKK
jgi:hypothetical protein